MYVRQNFTPIWSDPVSTKRNTIAQANARVDDIAADHGFALPASGGSFTNCFGITSAQTVRNRIAQLRHTVPNLTNAENSELDRLDLRLARYTDSTDTQHRWDPPSSSRGQILYAARSNDSGLLDGYAGSDLISNGTD